MLILFSSIFIFLSGAVSLTSEIVWQRLLSVYFGGDVISGALVTAMAIAGLGIGAAVFDRISRNNLRLLGILFLLIGLYTAISSKIIKIFSGLIGNLVLASGNTDLLLLGLVLTAGLCILMPMMLYGGVLPLFLSILSGKPPGLAGILYALNAAGSALGIILTPFVLVKGLTYETVLSSCGFFMLFSGAVLLFGHQKNANDIYPDNIKRNIRPAEKILLTMSFLSGMLAIIAETILLRTNFILWPSSSFSFPVTIFWYLTGVSTGGLIASFRTGLSKSIGWLFILSFTGLILGLFLTDFVARGNTLSDRITFAAFVILPHALFQGTIFPIILTKIHSLNLPGAIGRMLLVNAAGTITGSILIQFIVYRLAGMFGVLTLAFAVSTIGLFVSLFIKSQGKRNTVFALLTAILVLFLLPQTTVTKTGFGQTGGELTGIEGETGSASIEWYGNTGDVKVNGQYMSRLPAHPKHIQLEIYPLILPRHSRILILGLGSGSMVRSFLIDPSVTSIDVVDWSRELISLHQKDRVKQSIDDALSNPRVKIINADARIAVKYRPKHLYDVIVDNLSAVEWSGATNIKSVEYFSDVKKALKPDGVYVLDINAETDNGYNGVISGLTKVFPYVETEKYSIALSSVSSVEFNDEAINAVLDARKHIPELGINPVNLPEWIYGYRKVINRKDYQNIPPIHDNQPVFEYAKAVF